MSLVYVHVAEEDPAAELAALVGGVIPAEKQKLQKLASTKKYAELVSECVRQLPALLESEAVNASTLRAVCAVALALVQKSASAGKATSLVEQLAAALAADPTKHAVVKLEQLTDVFNLLGQKSPARQSVLVQILDFALASEQTKRVTVDPARVQQWVADLGLSGKKADVVYDKAVQVLRAQNKLADVMAIRRVQAVRADAQDAASDLLLNILHQGALCRVDDVLQLPAVQALSSPALALVQALATADMSELSALVEKHAETLGLCKERLQLQARMFVLLDAASATRTTSFQELMERLQLDDELALEEVVVEACECELFEARIDELNKTVEFVKSFQRQFTAESWDVLAERLTALRQTVQKCQTLLDESQNQLPQLLAN
ncbi:MAG: hypothetical protein MHM6MM_000837 [Cercozoa sp. M6MM]